MNPLLARASSYDAVNLWMNLAKVLILFVFIYQETLYSQLGLNMFRQRYYVYHAGQKTVQGFDTDTAEGRPGNIEIVETRNPLFHLTFLPVTISARYDRVRLEILQVEIVKTAAGSVSPPRRLNIDKGGDAWYRDFLWPGLSSAADKTPLCEATFNLRELVSGTLASGTYGIRYAFSFHDSTGKIYEEGFSEADSQRYALTLEYRQTGGTRFGVFPVVQGQWFGVPDELRTREFTLTTWRYRKTEGKEDSWSAASVGEVVRADRGQFFPRGVSTGNTYEQNGYYRDESENQVDFTVAFSVLENLPPRSTYLGPAQQYANVVTLYSDWVFQEHGTQFFNLSRYIIDPDGRNGRGNPDVKVRRMALAAPSDEFELVEGLDKSGDFWLVPKRDIRRMLFRRGDHKEVRVRASDEVNEKVITVSVERY